MRPELRDLRQYYQCHHDPRLGREDGSGSGFQRNVISLQDVLISKGERIVYFFIGKWVCGGDDEEEVGEDLSHFSSEAPTSTNRWPGFDLGLPS